MKFKDFKAMILGVPETADEYPVRFTTNAGVEHPLSDQIEVDGGDVILGAQGQVLVAAREPKVCFRQ